MDDGERIDRNELLALIGSDVRRDGKWLMTWCPAHADGTKNGRRGKAGRSLGLSDDGVIKCFAGCKLNDILNAYGYVRPPRGAATPRPISSAPSQRRPDVGPDETVAAVYEFRDADGKLVAEKARIEMKAGGKRFSWRMPGVKGWPNRDNGGGLINLAQQDIPAWGTDLVAKSNPKEWVLVTEGEKAAQACRDKGFLAVSWGGGADQRLFGNTLQFLKNRKVALWPDNDDAGFRYMTRLARLLDGIAGQIRYITVPGGPKEDAYDFFYKDNGSPQDVFKTVWEEPLVEYAASDNIRVTVFTKLGPVLFDFQDMSYTRGELHTELEVQPLATGMDQDSLTTRQNLISSSGREGLERMLKKQFGDANWTQAISQAYRRARDAFNELERGLKIGDAARMQKLEFFVEGLFAEGHHSIVFGDGSSGKTMWLYAIAIAVAAGIPIFGCDVKPGAVLLVDYETSEELARWRIERLMTGMGMDAANLDSLPIYYWPGGGIPIAEQAENIRRFARKHGINFMIVDSGGVACGMPPEKSEAAIQYFAGCQRTGIDTVVTICHVSALSDGQFPFGSKFWHNLARATYFMKASGVGSDEIGITLYPRKANETKRGEEQHYVMEFSPQQGGPIVIENQRALAAAQAKAQLDDEDRIWAALMQQPGMKSYEVAQVTGIKGDKVAQILESARGRWVRMNPGFGTGGSIRTWEVTTQTPPSELAS